MNFADFGKKFKNEQSCINFLIKERWGSKKSICCPRCNHKEVYIYKNNKTFKCKGCLKQFSIRIGTILKAQMCLCISGSLSFTFSQVLKREYLPFSLLKLLEQLKKPLGLC